MEAEGGHVVDVWQGIGEAGRRTFLTPSWWGALVLVLVALMMLWLAYRDPDRPPLARRSRGTRPRYRRTVHTESVRMFGDERPPWMAPSAPIEAVRLVRASSATHAAPGAASRTGSGAAPVTTARPSRQGTMTPVQRTPRTAVRHEARHELPRAARPTSSSVTDHALRRRSTGQCGGGAVYQNGQGAGRSRAGARAGSARLQ